MNNIMNKYQTYVRTLLSFFVYFLIAMYGGILISSFGIKSEILIMFLKDVLFFIYILWMYFNNIKQDIVDLKKIKIRKTIINIVIWVLIILIGNMLFCLISSIFINLDGLDLNTSTICSLSSLSLIYTIFKAMIFSVIAEQLLFRESIRESFSNKWLFVIVSASVATIMNFVFRSDLSSLPLDILYNDIAVYFFLAAITSIAYIQNKSNIVMLMLIYFFYNLIPLILNLILC